MATGRCMNVACGATEPGGAGLGEWRRGWRLRSGGFATLCIKCGMAYEQFVFCHIFHQTDSGWRECSSCGKRLHCGCIASKSSFDLLDTGGIQCIGCIKNSESSSMTCEVVYNFLPQHYQRGLELSVNQKDEKMNGTDRGVLSSAFEVQVLGADRKNDNGAFTNGKNVNGMRLEHLENECGSFGQSKWEKMNLKTGNVGITSLSNRYQPTDSLLALKNQSTGSSPISQQDESKDLMRSTLIPESLSPTCLSMSLGTVTQGNKLESTSSTERQLMGLPQVCAYADGKEQSKSASVFQQMQKARCHLPKPPKAINGYSDASKDSFPSMRVARPPADGRGRNQLLPRYWPRITDQELQQISGDSNSTIVPLFEKVLSASDAGRIGRLVLPKACAEAYFPPISQPEGLPLTIQDAKGKDWHFQFRFWPNNNSRMYVLEGVTPCIQSLQLQAGDTVTFSRIDPEGKLVMGYRKATNNTPLQDSQICTIANGGFGNESFFTGVSDKMSILNGYSGLLQQTKGSTDLHLISQPEHLSTMDGDISWFKASGPNGGIQIPSYKRSRNIGASRRLLMDKEEALHLKLSWEEAQELLRPPPSAKPSIVMIEDHEVEEYEEPPIFGKKTIFTATNSGEQDQWVQCDDCSKWRRIPVDVLLPSKWTCADNAWDPKRCSCSAANELSPGELEILLQQYEDLRRRSSSSFKQAPSEMPASGLDSLATAAGLGDVGNQTSSSIATTTKHPRHRPGCTCIVCIQPPSGKGPKHNPNCTCNVCMTVKRRFKTLMMRKKKRQSEREEAEANKKVALGNKEDNEGTSSPLKSQSLDSPPEFDTTSVYSTTMMEKLDTDKGHIDLNCDPGRDENPQSGPPQLSMLSLLQVASRPLDSYLKQNGLTSLACEPGNQESPSSIGVPQVPGESEEKMADESQVTTAGQGQVCHIDDAAAVAIPDVA